MERNEFRLNTNKEEAAINAGNSKLQIFPVFLIANFRVGYESLF